MVGQIATRGLPAPIQASRRWPVERTHAWGNQDGKLRWCTERRRLVVEFWLALASAIVCGRLVRRAWTAAHAAAHDLLAQPVSEIRPISSSPCGSSSVVSSPALRAALNLGPHPPQAYSRDVFLLEERDRASSAVGRM
jgi:hypothetical protein